MLLYMCIYNIHILLVFLYINMHTHKCAGHAERNRVSTLLQSYHLLAMWNRVSALLQS